MTLLDGLKVVEYDPHQLRTPQQARRNKLIAKLQEQISLAEAQLNNSTYTRMRWVTEANFEGEPVEVQRPVRVKKWWFKGATGNLLLTVRYGAKAIAISGNKKAIELGTLAEVPRVLETVISAVEAGELDQQLDAIALERKHPKLNKSTKIPQKKL